jgi:hypothetical protein
VKINFDVVDTGILDRIEINGQLVFNNEQPSSKLQAKSIWVR